MKLLSIDLLTTNLFYYVYCSLISEFKTYSQKYFLKSKHTFQLFFFKSDNPHNAIFEVTLGIY